MMKRNRLMFFGLLVAVFVIIAGVGSYAVAQSGGDHPSTATIADGASRHVDYDVTLQVNGDLSAVNPKLQGLLPLNLNAKGGADIEKTTDGPAVQGNVKLSGLDTVIQKLSAGSGSSNGTATLGAGIISGALSDLQFVAVDHNLYVNLGGIWYDTGDMAGKKCRNSGEDSAAKDQAKSCAEDAFAGGPQALLKDVKTIGHEDIDGTSTTHNSATVDLDKALTEASIAARNCGKTDEAARLDAAKSQITGAFKTLKVEWWIDDIGQLRQARIAVEANPASLASLAVQRLNEKPAVNNTVGKAAINPADVLKGITSVTLNATVKFSNFGEDFHIAKPGEDIKPLKDLMGLMGGHKSGQGHGANLAWHKDNNDSNENGSAATSS